MASEVSLFKFVVFKSWRRIFGLCLHLEMVDVRSHFGLNSIKTYVDRICAQLFRNWALNTIVQP